MDAEKKKLLKIISQELHKPAIKHFDRRKVKTKYNNETYAIDLVEMQQFADENNGYKYILNMIDTHSRYAWSEPMKTKSADEVLKTFKKIINESGYLPEKLWVDEGKEFYNSKFQAFLKTKNITMYSTHGEHKSAMIERFNRTMKEKMWMKFTENDSQEWISLLPELLYTYNHTVHRMIKMTPSKAMKKERVIEKTKQPPLKKPKFQIGDRVRISKIKRTFEKGYTAKWSHEIYTVKEIFDSKPITYVLEDYNKEEVKGKFYEQEMQKTKQEDVYLVEKIIETKKVGKTTKHLVKWVGYPASFNSWIDKSQLTE